MANPNISTNQEKIEDVTPIQKTNVIIEKDSEVTTQESSSKSAEEPKTIDTERVIIYIRGWRFGILFLAICLCIFIANMEAGIVSTSFVTIANDLYGFKNTTWIVSAYQITYTGFLVVWAKSSDILGRKYVLIVAILVFVVFSGACGAAQTLEQLISFRAFQGFGASGTFSLSTVVAYEMVPKSEYPLYGGIVFAIVTFATVAGPLLGGAIDAGATWRWIFLLNVPLGAAVIALLLAVMPDKYPYHGSQMASFTVERETIKQTLRKIDFIGALLLLTASFMLVTALLEVSANYPWSSPTIITLFTLAGIFWPLFFAWERYIGSKKNNKIEPLFPWRFMSSRIWAGMLLASFLLGIPFTIVGIEIPQRFQIVNGTSALGAGVRLLPYIVSQPLGSLFGNTIAGTTKIPPIFLLFFGSGMQLIALGLMTVIPASGTVPHAEYFFEALMGFGGGTVFSVLMLIAPHIVDTSDLAVATNSIVQTRFTGGSIGLALGTSVMNSYLKSHLSQLISAQQLQALLQNVSVAITFPKSLHGIVEEVFGAAYNLNIKIVIVFAGLQVLAVALIWQKKQLSIH